MIKFLTFLSSIIFAFLFLNIAHAASPQFLVSWQALNYAPSWYQGKNLPTKSSPVFVSFDLINNGKIINISQYKIRWYLNDELMLNEDKGLGLKSFYFINDNYANQNNEIKISIPDYGQGLDKIINIPVVQPEAVIDAPYSNNQIDVGKNSLSVIPFFFNVSDINKLSFDWTLNDNPAQNGENTTSQNLDLNIDQKAPAGFNVNIGVVIKNLLDQFQFASKNIQLITR